MSHGAKIYTYKGLNAKCFTWNNLREQQTGIINRHNDSAIVRTIYIQVNEQNRIAQSVLMIEEL